MGQSRHAPGHSAQIVLVHGGFLGPWSWADVVAALHGRGIATVVPDLPSMGDPNEVPLGDFYADASEVRRVLDLLSGPVLLCGHSYGGAVITEAAAGPHPSVGHLVYLAGAVLDVAESMASFAPADGGEAPETPDKEHAAAERPVSGPAGSIVLPVELGIVGLFHDCSAKRARQGAELLRSWNPTVGAQPTTGAAWRELPTTFIRGTQDRLPEIVTSAFFECGPEIVELSAGHCPNWSRPEAVAELLARARGAPSVDVVATRWLGLASRA